MEKASTSGGPEDQVGDNKSSAEFPCEHDFLSSLTIKRALVINIDKMLPYDD